jgi:ribonuclease HIII
MPRPKSYVCTLTEEQIEQLRVALDDRNWSLGEAPYAHWKATQDKTNVVAYCSGKVTVQGRGTPDMVQFILEPYILGEARYGYEHILAETENPEMFQPHAGIDESGKGDYFGPLVIACAYVEEETARKLLEIGVTDSKAIKNDRRIADLADQTRALLRGQFEVIAIGPAAYNRLYAKIGNVNRLLAWGHAQALENLLERVPECPRAISDQFGRKETVIRALKERGRAIKLEQRTKAESDIAVAAASVLARHEFVRRLGFLGKDAGRTLPKGASAKVVACAKEIGQEGGEEALAQVAKLHFRTTRQALGLPPLD